MTTLLYSVSEYNKYLDMGRYIYKKKIYKYYLEHKLFQWSDVFVTPSISTTMIY